MLSSRQDPTLQNAPYLQHVTNDSTNGFNY